MISYLKGIVKNIDEGSITLLCNGVGWHVKVSNIGFGLGEEVEMYIYTSVREDDISLWGFKSPEELKLFKLLISVNGIGVKTASSLLLRKPFIEIIRSIVDDDPKGLSVSGLGSKNAKKIILELRDKLPKEFPEAIIHGGSGEVKVSERELIKSSALEALRYLGYNRANVEAIVDKAIEKRDSVEEVIKYVLNNV